MGIVNKGVNMVEQLVKLNEENKKLKSELETYQIAYGCVTSNKLKILKALRLACKELLEYTGEYMTDNTNKTEEELINEYVEYFLRKVEG